MKITSAQYVNSILDPKVKNIKAVIDDRETYVPLTLGNRHYDEIMRQVAAGTLTIADAD